MSAVIDYYYTIAESEIYYYIILLLIREHDDTLVCPSVRLHDYSCLLGTVLVEQTGPWFPFF